MSRQQRTFTVAFVIAVVAGGWTGCDQVLGINEFEGPPPDGGTDAIDRMDASGDDADATGPDDAGEDATADSTAEAAPPEASSEAGDAGDAGDSSDASDSSDAGHDPVVSISVGSAEACALTQSGALYCWGPGPIGDGTSAPRWEATRVPFPSGTRVLGACAGIGHACLLGAGGGATIPAGQNGTGCWGDNEFGQGGTGQVADSGVPLLSPASYYSSNLEAFLACGAYHTCVAPTVAGASIKCWGSNSAGELGHTPGTAGDVGISSSIVTEANPDPSSGGLVPPFAPTAPLALGNGFSCGVFNQQVYCWGNNASHQLNSTDAGAFTPSPVSTLTGISEIAAGTNHACALDSSGHVTCWGDDSSAQLGSNGPPIGTLDASAVNISVDLGAPGPANHIAGGGNATCATFASGEIECWGANEHGQLGHDPTTDPGQCPGNAGPCNPSAIAHPLSIAATALAMGPTATCVVKTDHTVWCWGSASLVGNGVAAPDASTIQFTPVQVQGLPPP